MGVSEAVNKVEGNEKNMKVKEMEERYKEEIQTRGNRRKQKIRGKNEDV